MKAILDRMLTPAAPPRTFGIIAAVAQGGRYAVTDSNGRKITVDGPAGYAPGTSVIIQAARIVGTGARAPVSKTLKV